MRTQIDRFVIHFGGMNARSSIAIAYLRVSTEEQRLGPEAQRAAITTFTGAHGLVVRSWHLDQGVSGAAPVEERPALLAAISELRAGTALVVAKRDRLARDLFVAAGIEMAVRKCRARILSADGNNENTPEAGFMRGILDVAAEYERKIIATRTSNALQAKKRRHERVGMVPFGYKIDPNEPLDADVHHLVPDEREQAVVTRILELRREGLGTRRIARACQAEGLVSRSGKPLLVTQIQRILTRVGKQ
jgi:DNA invertase Pin-like site-specific DNA recombinase